MVLNKVIEETVVVRKTIEKRTCDICGKRKLEDDDSWNSGATFEYFDYGGLLANNKKTLIDVCMHCMKNEIMPQICEKYNIIPRTE